MINIHSDKNKAILDMCNPLYEYASFTDKIYEYKQHMDIEEAVNKALDEMPEDWLIKGYLISNKAEGAGCSVDIRFARTGMKWRRDNVSNRV